MTEDSLRRSLTLTPLPGLRSPPLVIDAGMGLYSNAASPYGPVYGNGGEGPGYNVTADVYLETAIGRVAAAVFVDTSVGAGHATLRIRSSDSSSPLRVERLDDLEGRA